MTTGARKPKRRPYWKWIAALALVLCLTLEIAWHSRRRSLLEQSTKMVNTPESWAGPVHWLSSHHLLFLRWPEREGVYIYDTQTQKETFLKSLSQELHPDFQNGTGSLCMSPDGTRALWSESDSGVVHGAWLDGSHYFTCTPDHFPSVPPIRFTPIRWRDDSRHWVAFVNDQGGATKAKLYDGNPLHKPETVPITAHGSSDPLRVIYESDSTSFVLGNHLLVGSGHVETAKADICEICLNPPIGSLKIQSVLLPLNASLEEIVISPERDRIAWHFALPDTPEWARQLERWVPQIHVRAAVVESLWVSRIDGTQMREIGNRPLLADESFPFQIGGLQWIPGSQRLGFQYRGIFYTVPVE